MKNSMKALFITLSLMCFGLAEETVTETPVVEETSVVNVHGELSTDFTFGDAIGITGGYTGLTFSGDGWVVSTNLSDGMVNIEEAKYTWNMTDMVALTFGSQAEPYGLAWGLHRPSNNWFTSTPREHTISTGVSVKSGLSLMGVSTTGEFFYGGGTEDVVDTDGNVTEEGSQIWATRVSAGLNVLGIDSNVGLSLNSDEAQLIDVSSNGAVLGFPYEVTFEYDLAEEADGAFWLRGVVAPEFLKGAYLLVGFNSDEEVMYGVGYKCSDNFHFTTEFSTEDTEDNDISIRASYSF